MILVPSRAGTLSYALNAWFRAAAGQSIFLQQYTKCPVEVEQLSVSDIVVSGEDQKEAQKEALAVSARTGILDVCTWNIYTSCGAGGGSTCIHFLIIREGWAHVESGCMAPRSRLHAAVNVRRVNVWRPALHVACLELNASSSPSQNAESQGGD